jgi:DNA-binding NtrC family response regulator
VRSFKREIVRSALRLHNGNRLKAAQELQISRCYLHRLINQLNIEDDSASGEPQLEGAEDEVITTQVQ